MISPKGLEPNNLFWLIWSKRLKKTYMRHLVIVMKIPCFYCWVYTIQAFPIELVKVEYDFIIR